MNLPVRKQINLPKPEGAKFSCYLLPFLEIQTREQQSQAARNTNAKRNKRGQGASSVETPSPSPRERQQNLAIWQAAQMALVGVQSVRKARSEMTDAPTIDQNKWGVVPINFAYSKRHIRVCMADDPTSHQVAVIWPSNEVNFFWVAVFAKGILETYEAPLFQDQIAEALTQLNFNLDKSFGVFFDAEPQATNVYMQPIVKPTKKSVVYFILAEGGNRIKIGWTSDLNSRLKQLQTSCPYPPVVLHKISGDEKKERDLHEKFAHLRRHMEWFEDAPELRDYIDSLKSK